MQKNAKDFSYRGVKDSNGQVVIPPENPDYRLDPDDPMILIVGIAHDIGKVNDYKRDENGWPIGSRGYHSEMGARLLGRQWQYRLLPYEDRYLLVTIVQFYHTPHNCPLNRNGNETAYSDRAMAIMQLLIEADNAAGDMESKQGAVKGNKTIKIHGLNASPSIVAKAKVMLAKIGVLKPAGSKPDVEVDPRIQVEVTAEDMEINTQLPPVTEIQAGEKEQQRPSSNTASPPTVKNKEPATKPPASRPVPVKAKQGVPAAKSSVSLPVTSESVSLPQTDFVADLGIDLLELFSNVCCESGRFNVKNKSLNLGEAVSSDKYGNLLILKPSMLASAMIKLIESDYNLNISKQTANKQACITRLYHELLISLDNVDVLYREHYQSTYELEKIKFDTYCSNQKTASSPGNDFVLKSVLIVRLEQSLFPGLQSLLSETVKLLDIRDEGSTFKVKPDKEQEKNLNNGTTVFVRPSYRDEQAAVSAQTGEQIDQASKPAKYQSDAPAEMTVTDTTSSVEVQQHVHAPTTDPEDSVVDSLPLNAKSALMGDIATGMPGPISSGLTTASLLDMQLDIPAVVPESESEPELNISLDQYNVSEIEMFSCAYSKNVLQLLHKAGVLSKVKYQDDWCLVSQQGFKKSLLSENEFEVLKQIKYAKILIITDEGLLRWPLNITTYFGSKIVDNEFTQTNTGSVNCLSEDSKAAYTALGVLFDINPKV